MKIAVSPYLMCIAAFAIAASGCTKPEVQSKSSAEPAAPNSATQPTSAKEVRAYIDPATGQLREPTAEEIAAENAQRAQNADRKQVSAAKTDASSTGKEAVLPSGAVEVTLDPAKRHELKACVLASGEIVMAHDCPAIPSSNQLPNPRDKQQ